MEELFASGYTIFSVMNAEEVAFWNEKSEIMMKHYPGEFVASSHVMPHRESVQLGEALNALLAPVVRKKFPHLEMLGASLLTKRPGKSALSAHRDWNIVDETKYRSYNLWVALSATNPQNGSLHLIAGSHLDSCGWRGDGIITKPVVYQPNQVIALTLQPGEAVLYDHRMVHFSPANTTLKNRNIVVAGFKDAEATLQVGISQQGAIEVFEVLPDDFYPFNADRIRQQRRLIQRIAR